MSLLSFGTSPFGGLPLRVGDLAGICGLTAVERGMLLAPPWGESLIRMGSVCQVDVRMYTAPPSHLIGTVCDLVRASDTCTRPPLRPCESTRRVSQIPPHLEQLIPLEVTRRLTSAFGVSSSLFRFAALAASFSRSCTLPCPGV